MAGKNHLVRRQLPHRTAGPIAARPPATPDDVAASSSERRNPTSREELLRRINVEYHDMPGLRLTLAQAQRLFGLREDICVRVLNALVQAQTLGLDANGAYARKGARP